MHKHRISRRTALAGVSAGVVAVGLKGCTALSSKPGDAELAEQELVVCGAAEVFILSLARGREPRKVWSWTAAQCEQIPEQLRQRFATTDDCKPVNGGKHILISSSGGAITLVEHDTKKAVFWSPLENAHSIEMLPGGRIAAAASTGKTADANRVAVFEIESRKELGSDELISAHGLVWDEHRKFLWALGKTELRAYRIEEKAGRVTLVKEHVMELPGSGGHDLSPISGGSLLFVSAEEHCWVFDRESRKFSPHGFLGESVGVKSHSVNGESGQIAFVQAEGKDWWAQRIHLRKPDGVIELPGQKVYKARWRSPG